MKYVVAALVGALVGAITGGLLGVPLMQWGPGSNDPLSGLWVVVSAILTAPAGIVVAVASAWGTPPGRLVAGSLVKPALVGALVTSGVALALFQRETLDEWFNLAAFAGMGAVAGVLTSRWLRPGAAPGPRRGTRPAGPPPSA